MINIDWRRIAQDVAESEVERRLGEWRAVEVLECGGEQYTPEAKELYDEAYDSTMQILKKHLTN